MTFIKSYTTSSTGYIKLKQACVCHRLSVQQGNCMTHLTRNSLTPAQFESLFCLPVSFPNCHWEMDSQGLSEAQGTPEFQGTFCPCCLCSLMADKSAVSLEEMAWSFGLLNLPKSREVIPPPHPACAQAHPHSRSHHSQMQSAYTSPSSCISRLDNTEHSSKQWVWKISI